MNSKRANGFFYWRYLLVIGFGMLLCCLPLSADEASRAVAVNSVADLEKAVSRARPGEVVLLAPGRYHEKCTLTAKGTALHPVEIRPQIPGTVELGNHTKVYSTFMLIRVDQ